MLKRQQFSILNNEKGTAVFEVVPIIMVIILFVNFSLGFFGAIHTGILNSIASRNYAFETFRNRANLVYFKNTDASTDAVRTEFSKQKMRVHATNSEKSVGKSGEPDWIASTRLIDFANSDKRAADITGNDKATHTKTQGIPDGRNQNVGTNPIWIKTAYGICLNAQCGT
ncbi:MAG: hypothetical protein ACXVCY_11675 [Pseudobdellovibrionaceae bacterium]